MPRLISCPLVGTSSAVNLIHQSFTFRIIRTVIPPPFSKTPQLSPEQALVSTGLVASTMAGPRPLGPKGGHPIHIHPVWQSCLSALQLLICKLHRFRDGTHGRQRLSELQCGSSYGMARFEMCISLIRR